MRIRQILIITLILAVSVFAKNDYKESFLDNFLEPPYTIVLQGLKTNVVEIPIYIPTLNYGEQIVFYALGDDTFHSIFPLRPLNINVSIPKGQLKLVSHNEFDDFAVSRDMLTIYGEKVSSSYKLKRDTLELHAKQETGNLTAAKKFDILKTDKSTTSLMQSRGSQVTKVIDDNLNIQPKNEVLNMGVIIDSSSPKVVKEDKIAVEQLDSLGFDVKFENQETRTEIVEYQSLPEVVKIDGLEVEQFDLLNSNMEPEKQMVIAEANEQQSSPQVVKEETVKKVKISDPDIVSHSMLEDETRVDEFSFSSSKIKALEGDDSLETASLISNIGMLVFSELINPNWQYYREKFNVDWLLSFDDIKVNWLVIKNHVKIKKLISKDDFSKLFESDFVLLADVLNTPETKIYRKPGTGEYGATIQNRLATKKVLYGHRILLNFSVKNTGQQPIYDLLVINAVPKHTSFISFVENENISLATFYWREKDMMIWKLYEPLRPGDFFEAFFVLRLDPWNIN